MDQSQAEPIVIYASERRHTCAKPDVQIRIQPWSTNSLKIKVTAYSSGKRKLNERKKQAKSIVF
jgi:hypothetical protein